MRFSILVLVFSVLFSVSVSASDKDKSIASVKKYNSTATINGKVMDKVSGEGLAGVQVKLYGTNMATYTDFEGNYSFNDIEAGAHAVVTEYVSYRLKAENVYAEPGNSKFVAIEMSQVNR